jgi:carbonic anhydrase/acetyltransferase-like protein (isoleucine patch superfamily)/acyl carrier protein
LASLERKEGDVFAKTAEILLHACCTKEDVETHSNELQDGSLLDNFLYPSLHLYKYNAFSWQRPTDMLATDFGLGDTGKFLPDNGRAIMLTHEHIRNVIFTCIKDTLSDVPSLTDDTLLMDLQMDSMGAVSFVTDVSSHLEETGIKLPPDFMFVHPSIGEMISGILSLASTTMQKDTGADLRSLKADLLPVQTHRHPTSDYLENLPTQQGCPSSWLLTFYYFVAMGYVSAVILFPGWLILSRSFQYGLHLPVILGVLVLAPCAKLVYVTILLGLVILSKKLILGNIKPNEHFPLASVKFVQYWAVTRLMSFANILVLGELKRTYLLNTYYRLMGSRIGRDVLIDTVGITDPDMVIVHDGTVIGNGVLLLGHTIHDGFITFGTIAIGQSCTIEPRAILKPEARVDHFTTIPALASVGRNQMQFQAIGKTPRSASSDASGAHPAKSFWREMLDSLGHVGGLFLTYALASSSLLVVNAIASAMSDSRSQGGIMSALATLQLTSGLYLPFLPLFVGVDRDGFAEVLMMALTKYDVIGIIWIFPAFYLGYSCVLIAVTALVKWLLIGKTKPGTSIDKGRTAWCKWFCDTLLEYSFRHTASLTLGTSFINFWLSILGAKIGWRACIRVCNGIHDMPDSYRDPELIDVGKDVHVGDRAALITGVTCRATDGEKRGNVETTYGVIKIGDRALIGMGSVILEGARIPAGTGVGALCCVTSKDSLKEGAMHMGNPRPRPIYHISAEGLQDRNFSAMEWFWYFTFPLIQPLVITAVISVAGFFTCLFSMLSFWEYTPASTPLMVAPFIYMIHGFVLCMIVVLLKWALLGRMVPSQRHRTYDLHYYTWNMVLMVQSIVHLHFTELLRGSPFYNVYFRWLGVHIERNVFLEAVSIPDVDMIFLGEGSVVEQNVLLGGHSYEAPFLSRNRVHIGKNCVVRPTAATLPEFRMEDGSELDCLEVGLKGMVVGRRDSID